MKNISIGDDIVWRLLIPASIDKVYKMISTDSGRASFWAESAIEEGGQINFKFINGYSYKSKILEKNPPHSYEIEYFDSIARFNLIAIDDNTTELKLTNSNVDKSEWLEVHAGWLNVLFPLKAMASFGIDLRNHDPQRTWDQGFADQ